MELALEGSVEPFQVSVVHGRLVGVSPAVSVEGIPTLGNPRNFDVPLWQFSDLEVDSDALIFAGRISESSIEIAVFSTYLDEREEHAISHLVYSDTAGALVLISTAQSDPPSLVYSTTRRGEFDASFVFWGPLPSDIVLVLFMLSDGTVRQVIPRGRSVALLVEMEGFTGVSLEGLDSDGEVILTGQLSQSG